VPFTVVRDAVSPIAVITATASSSVVTLTVAWGAQDSAGGSGVAAYDVQVSV